MKTTKFEIYISDNNSTDGTENLVKRLMKRNKCIHYMKNDSKMKNSFGSNIINLFENINTEFVWLFGDDDIIKKNAIKKIMNHLSDNDFLQINSEVWDQHMNKRLQERRLNIKSDIIYECGKHEQVLKNSDGGYAGFIAAIITRGAYIKKELKKFKNKNLSDEEYLHLTLFFLAIVGKKGKLIAEPLIKYRANNKSTFNRKEFEITVSNFPTALKRLRPNYSNKVIHDTARFSLYRAIAISCITKIMHPEKVGEAIRMIRENEFIGPISRIVMLLIFISPNMLVKMFCLTYIKIKNFPLYRV